jgi:hypothetical protein
MEETEEMEGMVRIGEMAGPVGIAGTEGSRVVRVDLPPDEVWPDLACSPNGPES